MPRKPQVIPVRKDIDDVERPAEEIKKQFEEEKLRPQLLKDLKRKQKSNVGETQNIRELILKLSLFPNIYNKEFVNKYS